MKENPPHPTKRWPSPSLSTNFPPFTKPEGSFAIQKSSPLVRIHSRLNSV